MNRQQRLLGREQLSDLPINVEEMTHIQAWRQIMVRLSLYDAAYLELSARLSLPLATFDAALMRAASVANVALL